MGTRQGQGRDEAGTGRSADRPTWHSGSMRLSENLNLPMPPEAAAAMYTDPAYTRIRGRTLHAESATSEVEGDPAGAFTVTTHLELATEGIPDIARSLVGRSVKILEVQSWQAPAEAGARQGTIELTVQGAPASMRGHLELRPAGENSAVSIDGEFTAKVPLLGGRLEKAALPYVTKVLRAEERSAEDYRSGASA